VDAGTPVASHTCQKMRSDRSEVKPGKATVRGFAKSQSDRSPPIMDCRGKACEKLAIVPREVLAKGLQGALPQKGWTSL
jgi:hypothetical protein